jgi:hypothetical protein
VAFLVDRGANARLQDTESGYAPLHRAFLCCKLATAAALVRAGATVHEPRDHEGHTPLELLSRRWGRRAALDATAQPGEMYTWGDAGVAGLGRAVNGSQSRTARAGRVETGERVVAVAAGKARSPPRACSHSPRWLPAVACTHACAVCVTHTAAHRRARACSHPPTHPPARRLR